MGVTMDEVLAVLEPEEPDYSAVEGLGPSCLPHLEALFRGDDALLAAKAAYAASLLPDPAAHDLVVAASRSDDPSLRAAATGGAGNLPTPAAAVVLVDLLADRDVSVRGKAEAVVAADVADRGGEGGGLTLADLIEAIRHDRGQHGGSPSGDAVLRPGSLAPTGARPGNPMPGERPVEAGHETGGTSGPSLADRRGAARGPTTGDRPGEARPGLMPGEEAGDGNGDGGGDGRGGKRRGTGRSLR
ncbi:HEAT repeat domain-containing protein [Streptomyces cinereoruber]|uniref:HEAT repeat domain-containing protein n=1 Tax=Streptomyces cinereoruber TaxID=67260 RepID=UPI00363238A9